MSRHQQGQRLAHFDPAAHPIIARHIFGIESFRRIGVVVVPIVQRIESLWEASHASS